MYRFVDKEIESLGVRRKFVRHELFGEYFHPEQTGDYKGDNNAEYPVTVRVAGEEYRIPCRADSCCTRRA